MINATKFSQYEGTGSSHSAVMGLGNTINAFGSHGRNIFAQLNDWAQGQQPAQQELQAEQEVNMPEERVEQTGPTPQEIEHHQWQQERAQQEREEMERLRYGK